VHRTAQPFAVARSATANVQAQGQAEFTALSFELPVALVSMMNFEKPPCPLVPCSALLGFFYILSVGYGANNSCSNDIVLT